MSVLSALDRPTLERYRRWLRSIKIKEGWPASRCTNREMDKILESYGRDILDQGERENITSEDAKIIVLPGKVNGRP